MKKKLKKILVVCHDAGGAEIVSAFVKKNAARANFVCYVAGPALKIFARRRIKHSQFRTARALQKEIVSGDYDAVLTGTSWGSDIELRALKIAKKHGVKSISYLDHWVNYRERFGYPRKNWRGALPDEIWVGDPAAYNLAKKYFSGPVSVRMVPNIVFSEIRNRINKSAKIAGKKILFISEPLMTPKNSFGDKTAAGITETEILKDILSALIHSEQSERVNLIVRLHPSESLSKYNNLIKSYGAQITVGVSREKDIVNDFNKANLVIGMSSMALVLAAMSGKTTVSYRPSVRIEYRLPALGICKIKNKKALENFLNEYLHK